MIVLLSVLFWLSGVIANVIPSEEGPLLLTPLIEKGQANVARNLSAVDPTLFAGVDSHAAFITVNQTAGSHMFFWFFPAPGQPLDSTPWLIWLQGGPGGSSLFGLFNEIGPIQCKNEKAERMPVTWGSNYSLLFIDNPVGAGFSFTETGAYPTNEDQVGSTLLNFLQQFLEVFPELRKAPLFITGESYAGKYIPALGHYIHHYKNDSQPINLRGLAIGDGWTDPPTLLQYSKFGLQIGVLDPEQAKEVQSYEDKARELYKKNDLQSYSKVSEMAFFSFLSYARVRPYNFLEESGVKIDDSFSPFLENINVRKAIHVGHLKYKGFNQRVHDALSGELYLSVKPWLEELLEHYGVMCYSGQLDVIVAYALSVNTYRSLNWSGAEEYKKAKREPWYSDEEPKRLNSYVKQYGNFMDVLVRGAGHMVPHDQPRAAKQLIDRFVQKFKQ